MIDLTEIDPNLLISLYTKLRQVRDDGSLAGELPNYERLEVNKSHLIRIISNDYSFQAQPITQPTGQRREAVRLFCNNRSLTTKEVAQYLCGDPSLDHKVILEHILDDVFSGRIRTVPGFSFLRLLQEYYVGKEDIQRIKRILLDSTSIEVRKLFKDSLFLPPSSLELILAVLFAETTYPDLYKEIETAKDHEVSSFSFIFHSSFFIFKV